MSKLGINTGTIPNDNNGDSILAGAIKINSNFNEIYSYFGDGTNLNVLNSISQTWGTTLVGINTLKNVGIGTTNPTSKLTVGGNVLVSGVVTSSGGFIGSLSGTASTSVYSTIAYNLNNASNITSGIVSTSRLSGTYNINISGVANTSTFSNYSNYSGISTNSNYATTAGVSTYADVAGISTYATTAGVSTYADIAGIATFTTTAGVSAYSDNAGISTYAATAGVSTYAATAGVSTSSQGLTGTPSIITSNIFNSGIVTTSRLNVGTSGTVITTTDNGLVGVKTTSPRFPLEVGAVGSSGTSLYVNGDARITGILSVGQGTLTLDGSSNKINVGSGVTIDGSSSFIALDSIKFPQNTSLTLNSSGKLNIGGNSIEGRPEGVYNVKDYGAVGDGVTNDTSAFNNAITAAGDYGTVYAPPGNYKVNGILLNRLNQTINIDGTLIIDASSVGIIFDRTNIGSSTQNCNVFVKEIKHSGSPGQRPSDNSVGVSFRNGSFNTVRFGRIGFLHYAFKLEPGTISPEGLTSDNKISGNLIEWCRFGVYSAGGSAVSNHTEHTMVEVNFIAHYRYGIYKTNSTGSQKFWYVNAAFDAFPGENPDYIADVFDDYVQSNDENLSACWYQTYFSTDDNAYQGNAFTIGRNCYLFDVTRRKVNFGTAIKFDSYLGTVELTGPTGALNSSGVILTSANGTKYRLVVSNSGTLSTVAV